MPGLFPVRGPAAGLRTAQIAPDVGADARACRRGAASLSAPSSQPIGVDPRGPVPPPSALRKSGRGASRTYIAVDVAVILNTERCRTLGPRHSLPPQTPLHRQSQPLVPPQGSSPPIPPEGSSPTPPAGNSPIPPEGSSPIPLECNSPIPPEGSSPIPLPCTTSQIRKSSLWNAFRGRGPRHPEYALPNLRITPPHDQPGRQDR
jgi:hypothetical protein